MASKNPIEMKLLLALMLMPILALGQIRFMGFTSAGGENNGGTIFMINSDGTDFKVVHHMNPTADGSGNWGSPFLSSDGNCYGLSNAGGQFDNGTLFKIGKDGSGFDVIRNFDKASGEGAGAAGSSLIEDDQGVLYSMTGLGGENDEGSVFKINRDGGAFEIIKSFDKGIEGGSPQGDLLLYVDGKLYGMTQIGTPGTDLAGGTIFRVNKDGSEFEVIKYFDTNDPFSFVYQPFSSLIGDSDNFLYGTTRWGVEKGGSSNTIGSVFKVNPDGSSFTVLHYFAESDGQQPWGSPFLASNGYLYGMTLSKGENLAGTIYRIKRDGSDFSVLKSFVPESEGGYPRGSLIEGGDGYLYGQTYGVASTSNGGAIFKMKLDGSEFKVLKLLNSNIDGGQGRGKLVKVDEVITSVNDHILDRDNITILHPNPSSGIFQVAAESGRITISDQMGRVIDNFEIQPNSTVDVSIQKSGFYIVELRQGLITTRQKVLVR